MKKFVKKTGTPRPQLPSADGIPALLTELESLGNAERLREMETRYGIRTAKAFGVAMADIQKMARRFGVDHALAAGLWETGWYEARTLAALVEDPAQVTEDQMDRWCADFDNWAICDTVCFKLFDRSPYALAKVEAWARSRVEFTRRGAFALLASLALHDKGAPDEAFSRCLPLIEDAAEDDRNFVKKAVNWALRAIGERSPALHAAALATAAMLAGSSSAPARWVGKDAFRQLRSPAVLGRLGKRGI